MKSLHFLLIFSLILSVSGAAQSVRGMYNAGKRVVYARSIANAAANSAVEAVIRSQQYQSRIPNKVQCTMPQEWQQTVEYTLPPQRQLAPLLSQKTISEVENSYKDELFLKYYHIVVYESCLLGKEGGEAAGRNVLTKMQHGLNDTSLQNDMRFLWIKCLVFDLLGDTVAAEVLLRKIVMYYDYEGYDHAVKLVRNACRRESLRIRALDGIEKNIE